MKPDRSFRSFGPEELTFDPIRMIGGEWMLITAAKPDGSLNTMTASWGGAGVLWNKPVAFLFVRPQRYTKEFLDESDFSTVSFFDRSLRPALTVCGRKSGRNCDKIAQAGLTPRAFDEGFAFGEASLVLTLKKLYVGRLGENGFIDRSLIKANYPTGDFHYVYICEILRGYESTGV